MLEEIQALPENVLQRLPEDVENLKVYLVQDYSLGLLKRMVNFSSAIFGESAVGEWNLVPQIRHGNVFVLKEEGKRQIAGAAILMRDWEDVDKAYLFEYAIAQNLQGQGLGFHFLNSICQNLKEQGFQKMSLTVDINNEPAIKLYQEKLGFEVVAFHKNEYGLDQDRYIMELDLRKLKTHH